jgi:hypothetical protein
MSFDKCPDCKEEHATSPTMNAPDIKYHAADSHISCSRTPSIESQDILKFATDLDLLVPAVQTHAAEHTQTCWKDSNEKKSLLRRSKKMCRFHFPRPLVPESHFTTDGRIELQRLHHWTNNYNPWISAATRSNMDIQSMWGSDVRAMAAPYYMTNYSTKSLRSLLTVFPVIKAAFAKFEADKKGDPNKFKTREAESKSLLNRIYNQIQRDVELSSHLITASLCGFPERLHSHTFAKLVIYQFLEATEASDRERDKNSGERNWTFDSTNSTNTEETVNLKRVKGRLSASNLRIDYLLRPSEFDNMCLYDFVSTCEIIKHSIPEAMSDSDEDEETKRETDVSRSLRLHDTHPRFKTHQVVYKRNRFVPILYGPKIPSKLKHPEKYARMMLILFKPYTTMDEIRPSDCTWPEAFAEFEAGASKRILRLIDNVNALHQAGAAHELDRDRRKREEQSRTELPSNAFDSDSEDLDEEHFPDIDSDADDEEDDEARFRRGLSTDFCPSGMDTADMMRLYGTAKQAPIFPAPGPTPHIVPDNKRSELKSVVYAEIGDDVLIDDWTNELKERKKTNSPPARPAKPHKSKGRIAEAEIAVPRSVHIEPPLTASEIASKLSLNKQQRLAFFIVADTLEQELAHETDTTTRVDQLRMFMSGVGGTGKSYVIKAIQMWCLSHDKQHWLQTSAPTGTAASDIGGSTLHSLLGIKPRRGPDEDAEISTATRGRVADSMRGKKLLIIDEASMVNCKLAAEVNAALAVAFGTPSTTDWGGIHVLFVGDHSQLPPVGNKPLYAASALNANPDNKNAGTTKTIQGRLLWLRINTVVPLTEQMRQTDTGYLKMLTNMRAGTGTDEDFAMLEGRVQTPELLKHPKWTAASIAVVRNPVRTAFNLDHAIAFAAARNLPVLMVHARDEHVVHKKIQRMRRADRHRMLRMPDNKTNGLPGYFPAVPGLPCILRENEATELGLSNGSGCVIHQIVLDHREPPVPSSGVHYLQYLPLVIWMRFDGCKLLRPLTGVSDPHLIPITASAHPFEFKVDDEKTWRIKRTQFPLIPARAMTAHASQGKTLESLITDLHVRVKGGGKASAYVLLSRVKRREDLLLLRPFPRSVLNLPPDEELAKDEKRLRKTILQTVARYKRFIEPVSDEEMEHESGQDSDSEKSSNAGGHSEHSGSESMSDDSATDDDQPDGKDAKYVPQLEGTCFAAFVSKPLL